MAAEKSKRKPAAKKRRKPRTKKQLTDELRIELRRAKVVKLRVTGGLGLEAIASKLKCSVGTVHSDLEAVMVRSRDTANDEIAVERAVAIARLESVLPATLKRAVKGDDDAISSLVRIDSRIAKLKGTEAPIRSELSGPDGKPIELKTRDSLEHKLNELSQRLASGTAQPG